MNRKITPFLYSPRIFQCFDCRKLSLLRDDCFMNCFLIGRLCCYNEALWLRQKCPLVEIVWDLVSMSTIFKQFFFSSSLCRVTSGLGRSLFSPNFYTLSLLALFPHPIVQPRKVGFSLLPLCFPLMCLVIAKLSKLYFLIMSYINFNSFFLGVTYKRPFCFHFP